MKKIYLPVLIFCLLSLNTLAGELKWELLDAASKKVSDFISTLPGEGETQGLYAAAPDISLTFE